MLVLATVLGPFAMQVFLRTLPAIQASFGVTAAKAQLSFSLSAFDGGLHPVLRADFGPAWPPTGSLHSRFCTARHLGDLLPTSFGAFAQGLALPNTRAAFVNVDLQAAGAAAPLVAQVVGAIRDGTP
ncbi:MAG: hypothetical protein ACJ8H8_10810 [Geminicoccaceae bacterium]